MTRTHRALFVQLRLTRLVPVLTRTPDSGNRGQYFCTGLKINIKFQLLDFIFFPGPTSAATAAMTPIALARANAAMQESAEIAFL